MFDPHLLLVRVVRTAKNVGEVDVVNAAKFVHVAVGMAGLLTEENEEGGADNSRIPAGNN